MVSPTFKDDIDSFVASDVENQTLLTVYTKRIDIERIEKNRKLKTSYYEI